MIKNREECSFSRFFDFIQVAVKLVFNQAQDLVFKCCVFVFENNYICTPFSVKRRARLKVM